MKSTIHLRHFALLLTLLPAFLLAQTSNLRLAQDYLQANPGPGNWSTSDFSAVIIDQYTSQHNDVLHVYLQQQYRSFPVYNAIAAVHLRAADQQVLYHTNRFRDQLEQRVVEAPEQISPNRALFAVSNDLGISLSTPPLESLRSGGQLTFLAPELSDSPIPVERIYYPAEDGRLYLCWNLQIDDPRSTAEWNIFVDVNTGTIRNKKDVTIYCTFEHPHDISCTSAQFPQRIPASAEQPLGDDATYFVYPHFVESPNHGERTYLVDPADPQASPFGWHDTNGLEGPEYTITRGNNTHAYLDTNADDAPDGPEPDGGEALFFDFPYQVAGSPSENSNATITQLFYMNNVMHDFTYHFGFDEAAGNYQQNNYGKGGLQGDPVHAEAQDGSGLNNANFTPSADGNRGKMQMYLWSSGGSSNFTVSSPAEVAGGYPYTTAEFGPQIIEHITGVLAEGLTDSANPNTGCGPLVNAEAVAGKIVLIDRGDCFFEEKTIQAGAAGAIACVICNNTSGLIQMAGVDTIPDPAIPTIMIGQADCARFRTALQNGPVTVSIEAPDFLDSGFDNGIIAHEYGHGISTRLTGGPTSPYCLNNDEQMGEGWSDFFALAILAQPEDQGVEPRSIGTFAAGQSTAGSGIRRQRYSTDLAVNNQTYDDIIGTGAPHPLGEIWAATLWDIYWAFADKYGYDPDPRNQTAGNNIALQLIMDGMKLQSCQPGFVDGRDGIIAADLILHNGANECLLWEIFARRGLGWSTNQGSSSNRNDNVEAYDLRPTCLPNIKVSKRSTPNIQPGANFEVVITIVNDKPTTASEVKVEDLIPTGALLVPGSIEGATLSAINDHQLVFDLNELPPGQERIIRYQLQSDPALFSTQLFFDGAEDGGPRWSPSDLTGSDIWSRKEAGRFAGDYSWFVPNTDRTNDQALKLLQSIRLSAERPVLRFYHRYDIEPGLNGGIIEVSTNGLSWEAIDPNLIFREPFSGRVAYTTFGKARQKAFWGNSGDFVASYIDLKDYAGSDILLRFRFASDETAGNSYEREGWYVDNIEVLDMAHYATSVCVSTAEGDQVCAMVEEEGTIVETNLSTGQSQAELLPEMDLRIFPNPATAELNVQVKTALSTPVQLRLLGADGKLHLQNLLSAGTTVQTTNLDISTLPAGVYFLQVQTASALSVEKIVIQ